MSKLYRVVELWVDFENHGPFIRKNIGCSWKTERQAQEEKKTMTTRHPHMSYGIELKKKG